MVTFGSFTFKENVEVHVDLRWSGGNLCHCSLVKFSVFF